LKVETVGAGGIVFVQIAAGPSTMIVPPSRSRPQRAFCREIPKLRHNITMMAWKRMIPTTPKAIPMDSQFGLGVLVGFGMAGIFVTLMAMRCVE
jgi:hypothetical protein